MMSQMIKGVRMGGHKKTVPHYTDDTPRSVVVAVAVGDGDGTRPPEDYSWKCFGSAFVVGVVGGGSPAGAGTTASAASGGRGMMMSSVVAVVVVAGAALTPVGMTAGRSSSLGGLGGRLLSEMSNY